MRSKELKIENVGNKLKTVRGITLITLAITIILLIILAGVVINVTIGKNGIINRAKSAKEKYEIAQIREKIELEILNVELKEVELGNEVTIELVLQELLDNKTFDTIDKEAKIGYIDIYEIKLKYNETNKVVIEYIKEWTGLRVTYSLEPSTYTKQEKIDILLKVQGKVKSITKPDGLVIYPNQEIVGIDYYVTANGTYTFIIENEEGKKEEKNVIVDIIDRIEPKPFEITAQTTRTGGIKITANAEDEEANEENVKSGIGRYEYYVKNTTESEYTKYDTNEIISLPSGTYKVYAVVYDKAGNSTQSSNEAEVEVEEWLQIWNEEDLRNIANDLSKNYIIMQDIELTQEWTPLGRSQHDSFKGKLDGNNHKIIGLKITEVDTTKANNENTYIGLFRQIGAGSSVSNLSIIDCDINGYENVGAIGGGNSGTIENVKVIGTITVKMDYVGSFVGKNSGIIKNSCTFGTISGRSYVGGITGDQGGSIINSYSATNVSATGGWAGGLVGNNRGKISLSYATGDVTGISNIGGLVGVNNNSIINVYSTGKVTASQSHAGGIAGQNGSGGGAVIENAYSRSKVLAPKNANGIAGYGRNMDKKFILECRNFRSKYKCGRNFINLRRNEKSRKL